jgi:hypothetical protein
MAIKVVSEELLKDYEDDPDEIENSFQRFKREVHAMARASIDIYKYEKNVGYFSIILPVHLAFISIPVDVVQTINQIGDRFELKVQIETKDKNNRTYSKPFILNKLLPIVSK